ncbi:MAG: cupredoxin family copper-binding protein (plasmid) [Leptolyngbya sp. BL-A-14]
MKSLSYFFMAIASAVLVILLSLSSCRSTPQATTTPPMTMDHSPTTQPHATASSSQAQPQASAQPAKVTIKIRNFKFEPASVTIAVGETVQFINLDEEPHTATSTDGVFNSKGLDTNQTWNYTATKPGTFPYLCSIHPFMKGTLTVTPKHN